MGINEILGSGKGVMERCPNCGTTGRPGAKFCTTCGFRFPDEASDGEPGHDHTDPDVTESDEEPGLFPGAATDGWPSPPPPAATVGGGWGAQAATAETAPPEPSDMTEDENTPDPWAAGATESWPAPPTATVADTDSVLIESEPESDEEDQTDPVDSPNAAASNGSEAAEAMARAMRLLDELRQTISKIGLPAQSGVDLSGVISDLEVAVHPPGAMAADDVAELRDALLAARERPRDIDTIVDLTKRIDAMLALVIAYDRTIAAIERSLDALRG
jgi:hypothetical protein